MSKAQFISKKPAYWFGSLVLLTFLFLYMSVAIRKGNDFLTFYDIGIFFLKGENIFCPARTRECGFFTFPILP